MKPQDPAALIHAGVYPVDKPAGCTSFSVARRVRRLLNINKVGHAGTLDPFATGLLIVCAGREATRHMARFMSGEKHYAARLKLGLATDTLDTEGRVVAEMPVPALDMAAIRACLSGLTGDIMQKPPAFSALKHEGKPLYRYAREGVIIEKPARPVRVSMLEALAWNEAARELDIAVRCSSGTYVRTLAADIGAGLGTCAHLVALRRLASGHFRVDEALSGEALFAEDEGEARAALLAVRMDVETALGRATP